MNIFVLDSDIDTSVKYHTDKHVVKMILETAQLLSTAHRLLDDVPDSSPMYRATHKNHPCAKWVRESSSNYFWAYKFFISLCDEYTYRYGKIHLTDTKLRHVLMTPPANIPSGQLTDWPQCMPDQYKATDAVTAYRNYYNGAKRDLFSWKKRDVPDWVV